MIVIAIIAFLARIAVSQYFRYLAKAKQTEVMVNLASLHTAQQAFFAQNGRYSTILWGEEGIGWRPEGYKESGDQQSFNYTYGFYFSGAQEGKHYFVGKLKTPAEKLGSSSAQDDKFTAMAAGDIEGKGKVDVWSVDQDRTITNVEKGLN